MAAAVLVLGIGPEQLSVGGSDDVAGSAPECSSGEQAVVADRFAESFRSHRFVFIGSTHGGVKRHEFLLCLLSRVAFREMVTDVVVEFVSGAHQRLLDRYLLELEEVPFDSLRRLAFDTDYPLLFATIPQVPEFLLAVREVNGQVGLSDRIRVIGGSDTVEWSEIRSREDLAFYPFKTNWTAHLLTEHLAPDPDARVLVVYGDGHIQHGTGTLTANVEARVEPDSLFVVSTIPTLAEGERERVAAFGDPDHPFFVAAADFPEIEQLPEALFPIVTTSRTSLSEFAESGRLEEKVDALVYLGPSPDRNLKGALPLSPTERSELDRRDDLRSGSMNSRYGGRERWFDNHPHDLPPDLRRRGDDGP